MRVAVVGLARKTVEKQLSKYGLVNDKNDPEAVISFGGDGTALYAERMYPSVPRVTIRHSKTCVKCSEHDYSEVLSSLKKRDYEVKEEIKVEGIVNGSNKKKLVGLNEIDVHCKVPTSAMILKVILDGRILHEEVMGDGILVATPYGSTAYFYSITKKKFSKGLGIAFNNSRQKLKNLVVNDNSVIKLEVIKGNGIVTADNNPRMIPVKVGDMITIKKSKQKAKIIELRKISL